MVAYQNEAWAHKVGVGGWGSVKTAYVAGHCGPVV